jgi:3-hydroxymyristoyl/3-hydroxydecanoyl-(acyl carrier protein) dehydratase
MFQTFPNHQPVMNGFLTLSKLATIHGGMTFRFYGKTLQLVIEVKVISL